MAWITAGGNPPPESNLAMSGVITMCTWASMRPGSSARPPRSIRLTSDGTSSGPGLTVLMDWSSTSTLAPHTAAWPLPSMSRALVKRVDVVIHTSSRLLYRPPGAGERHVPKQIFVARRQAQEVFHALQFVGATARREIVKRLRQLINPGGKGVAAPMVNEALVWTLPRLQLFDLSPGIAIGFFRAIEHGEGLSKTTRVHGGEQKHVVCVADRGWFNVIKVDAQFFRHRFEEIHLLMEGGNELS